MDIKFSERKKNGSCITEVSFNTKMVYIVSNDPRGEYIIVDPYTGKYPSGQSFATFDDASAFAAAYVTGSYYE